MIKTIYFRDNKHIPDPIENKSNRNPKTMVCDSIYVFINMICFHGTPLAYVDGRKERMKRNISNALHCYEP